MEITPISTPRAKVVVPHLIHRKNASERLTMVTAYDSTFASIVDEAGVDLILVGDSVATVMQGQKTTLGVSMEHLEDHVQMVASVKPKDLIVGDSMLPLYTREKVIHPAKTTYQQVLQNDSNKWEFTHRLVSQWKDSVGLENEWFFKEDVKTKKTVHHKN